MTPLEALIHEFYKIFVDENHIASNGKYHPTAFLTMRAAIPDEIERFITKAYEAGRREAYKEIGENIKKLYRGERKLGADMTSFQPRVDDMDYGWNDAIDTILSNLKALKEK